MRDRLHLKSRAPRSDFKQAGVIVYKREMEETEYTAEIQEETDDTDESGVYELGYHIVPTVSEEELPDAVGTLKQTLTDAGISGIVAEEYPKHMRLAYEMERSDGGKRERYETAYFGWVVFEAKRDQLDELTSTFKANKNILRFLITATTRDAAVPPARVLSKPVQKDEDVSSDKPALTDEELDKTIEEMVKE